MRAEAAGDPGPWRQQELLGRDRSDADELRDLVRDYVVEHLGDEGAVLVTDEAGFLKKLLRRGATIHWFRREDHELSDRRVRGRCVALRPCLHGPPTLSAEELDGRPARLKAAHAPDDVGLFNKAATCRENCARHCGARPVRLGCGRQRGLGDIERDLRQAGKGYVLGVAVTTSCQNSSSV
jgi:hypothetical protein